MTKEQRFDRAAAIFGMGLLFLVIIVPCVFGAVALGHEPDPIPFSVEGWNSSRYNADHTFSYTRYKMVRDLLKRYDFHGWQMAEIEKLLSKPDEEREVDQKHLAYYDLGNGIEFLIFEVSGDRQIVDYYLHFD